MKYFIILLFVIVRLEASNFPKIDAHPEVIVKFMSDYKTSGYDQFLIDLLDYPDEKNSLFQRLEDESFPIHRRAFERIRGRFPDINLQIIFETDPFFSKASRETIKEWWSSNRNKLSYMADGSYYWKEAPTDLEGNTIELDKLSHKKEAREKNHLPKRIKQTPVIKR